MNRPGEEKTGGHFGASNPALGRESLAAAAEALLVSAIFLALLPERLLWLSPLPAILFLTCSWPRRIPRIGKRDAVFVPDPLAPDFKPLLASLDEMLGAVQTGGRKARMILMPMPSADGGYSAYAVDWEPWNSALAVQWRGGRQSRHCLVRIEPRAFMPIVAGSCPAEIKAEFDASTGRVAIDAAHPFSLHRLLSDAPPSRLSIVYVAWLAVLLPAVRIADGALDGRLPLLAVLAVAPPVVLRMTAFSERISRALAQNAAFARLLFRRFTGRL